MIRWSDYVSDARRRRETVKFKPRGFASKLLCGGPSGFLVGIA